MDKSPLRQPHQKLGLVVVVVIGLTTLIFGVISLRKSIFDPFIRRPSGITFKTTDELEQERIQVQKTKDTDGDGLTDYDELYIYRTSPFLDDTDSDGDLDGAEVKSGTDPNCPKDKVCRQQRTTQADSGDQTTEATDDSGQTAAPETPVEPADGGTAATSGPNSALAQLLTDTFGPPENLTPELITAKLESMSSAELHAFFIKLGFDKTVVDQADDATLRQIFLEAINELVNQAGAGSAAPGSTGTRPAGSQ